jgi:hypothetical protein
MRELTHNNRWPAAAVVMCALVFLVLNTVQPSDTHAAEKYQHLVNCDLHSGACTQQLDGTDVSLEVTPQPVKAMTDLLFKVTLVGGPSSLTSEPFIDLGMPGMNMGPNRVQLKASGPSSYIGQGVIVRCKSGRKIWQATVTLPDMGVVRFVFHVIY